MKHDLEARIIHALGLDDQRVKSVTFKFSDDDIPLVTIEIYPALTPKNFEWISELQKYKLSPRPPEETTDFAPL